MLASVVALLQEVAPAAHTGAAEAVAEPATNWLSVAFSFLNFAVLLFILIRFGGPIIQDMLRNRHLGIKKDLDEARGLREAAEQKLRTYEARLGNIEREIGELIAGIRAEAEAEAARIVKAAEESAARMRSEAEFVIKQEGRRLELELRREAAELAVETARKLLQAKTTDADQRRLAEQFVREMAGTPAHAHSGGNNASAPAVGPIRPAAEG
jgi:F-type H+-transporting ATPase subunit b